MSDWPKKDNACECAMFKGFFIKVSIVVMAAIMVFMNDCQRCSQSLCGKAPDTDAGVGGCEGASQSLFLSRGRAHVLKLPRI